MGYARIRSVTLLGVTGEIVTVEADLAPGLPNVVVSGLPDAALVEARDRVRAAIVNSGETWPQRRITINLTPAHLPKHGSGFDLANVNPGRAYFPVCRNALRSTAASRATVKAQV